MKVTEPWLITPALTPERLFRLADTAVRARARLIQLHQPDEGDNPWTFGSRAYKWTCKGYEKIAHSGEDPGMTIKLEMVKCSMSFDDVPLTFYRGDVEHPPTRALKRGLRDLANQPQLPYFEEQTAKAGEGWFWLLAIDTKEDGSVLSVGVVQANAEGDTRNAWIIPLDAPVAVVGSITPIEREAVKLPPPQIGIKSGVTDAGDGSVDGEEKGKDGHKDIEPGKIGDGTGE